MSKSTNKKPEITFSGQEVVEVRNGYEYVICAKCLNDSNLISTNGTGWWDQHTSKYVHRECLTEPR